MGYHYKADPELTRKQAFEATRNNWRKVNEGYYKNNRDVRIEISKLRFNDSYGVWKRKGSLKKGTLMKTFKTKTSAIRFAKDYMKRH